MLSATVGKILLHSQNQINAKYILQFLFHFYNILTDKAVIKWSLIITRKTPIGEFTSKLPLRDVMFSTIVHMTLLNYPRSFNDRRAQHARCKNVFFCFNLMVDSFMSNSWQIFLSMVFNLYCIAQVRKIIFFCSETPSYVQSSFTNYT